MYHLKQLLQLKLAAEGGEVVGVLIGENVQALGSELIQYGADRVVVVEDAKLSSIYIRWICSSITCSH